MSLPVIALAFGLVFHFGGQEVRRFERLAAEDLRSRLSGEAPSVEVKTTFASLLGGPLGELDMVTLTARDFSCVALPIFTEPSRSRRGRIGELRVHLTDFELAGLRVKSLEAAIPHCRFDYSAAIRHRGFHISQSGLGTARVRVTQDALAAFALRKLPMIDRLDVKVEKDKIFVEGSGQFVFAKAEFGVIAGIQVENGSRLMLATPRFFLNGRRADEATSALLSRTFGIVMDLNKDLGLFGAFSVEGLRLRDGVMEAWGAFRLPDLPSSPGSSR